MCPFDCLNLFYWDGSRYGYDYVGGYDRSAMAGRAAYPEERSHGRYMNRQSGNFFLLTIPKSNRLFLSLSMDGYNCLSYDLI